MQIPGVSKRRCITNRSTAESLKEKEAAGFHCSSTWRRQKGRSDFSRYFQVRKNKVFFRKLSVVLHHFNTCISFVPVYLHVLFPWGERHCLCSLYVVLFNYVSHCRLENLVYNAGCLKIVFIGKHFKSLVTSAIDHSFSGFTDAINHAG